MPGTSVRFCLLVATGFAFASMFPTPAPAQTVSFAPGDFAAGNRAISVALGDFNGDKVQDLAVANEGEDTVAVLLGNGDGTFQPARTFPVSTSPVWVEVGDFNGDRVTDLVVANINSNNVSVLLGNGDGTFQKGLTFAAGTGPDSVVVGDFNGDKIPDLAVANWFSGDVSVLLGNGDGTFQPARTFPRGISPVSPRARDCNGDGTFQAAQNFAVGTGPSGVAVGDFDQGAPQSVEVGKKLASDLAVANFNSNSVSVLINRLRHRAPQGPPTGP